MRNEAKERIIVKIWDISLNGEEIIGTETKVGAFPPLKCLKIEECFLKFRLLTCS